MVQSGVVKRIDEYGSLSSMSYVFKSKHHNILVDVDYDCLMEHVYFTDVIHGYIGRINTNSPSHEVVYQNLKFPEGKLLFMDSSTNMAKLLNIITKFTITKA